ncbi:MULTISPECIES: 3-hydroxyacyl-ACP dehydratase FabZ family protein [Streptomyces]|uniref:3-hydroxyacyl-ACP dehydratase FabZ family protein n=1 Tax=Streptomyces TaxID=1883 RepID=UPI00163CE6A1|nr:MULTISPECIES: beta-hydroxyacyl-ACP dehydratase [Streptomyces]MBC2875753.1 beta-hydroxyacyl-ACP dehydratase [Streptomyces sp. TYQ1024]UBI37606.1 beta-hydroxyacyl-ACP dehydratase [Streptomyces mobaraensis]UKW30194.1 beta-hydroxyacyl-ACP dehydratase [Streptomyces sp. TYQ1024]
MPQQLEYADIRRLVPHAHPMLLIDRVVEFEPYERIVTTKTVSGSEPCYTRLADGLGSRSFAYPPSLLMESWGQGGAVLWMKRAAAQEEKPKGPLILAAVRDVAFHRPVLPGDVLRHVVRVDQYVGDSIVMSGESYVGDERVSEVGYAIAVMRPADQVSWGDR